MSKAKETMYDKIMENIHTKGILPGPQRPSPNNYAIPKEVLAKAIETAIREGKDEKQRFAKALKKAKKGIEKLRRKEDIEKLVGKEGTLSAKELEEYRKKFREAIPFSPDTPFGPDLPPSDYFPPAPPAPPSDKKDLEKKMIRMFESEGVDRKTAKDILDADIDSKTEKDITESIVKEMESGRTENEILEMTTDTIMNTDVDIIATDIFGDLARVVKNNLMRHGFDDVNAQTLANNVVYDQHNDLVQTKLAEIYSLPKIEEEDEIRKFGREIADEIATAHTTQKKTGPYENLAKADEVKKTGPYENLAKAVEVELLSYGFNDISARDLAIRAVLDSDEPLIREGIENINDSPIEQRFFKINKLGKKIAKKIKKILDEKTFELGSRDYETIIDKIIKEKKYIENKDIEDTIHIVKTVQEIVGDKVSEESIKDLANAIQDLDDIADLPEDERKEAFSKAVENVVEVSQNALIESSGSESSTTSNEELAKRLEDFGIQVSGTTGKKSPGKDATRYFRFFDKARNKITERVLENIQKEFPYYVLDKPRIANIRARVTREVREIPPTKSTKSKTYTYEGTLDAPHEIEKWIEETADSITETEIRKYNESKDKKNRRSSGSKHGRKILRRGQPRFGTGVGGNIYIYTDHNNIEHEIEVEDPYIEECIEKYISDLLEIEERYNNSRSEIDEQILFNELHKKAGEYGEFIMHLINDPTLSHPMKPGYVDGEFNVGEFIYGVPGNTRYDFPYKDRVFGGSRTPTLNAEPVRYVTKPDPRTEVQLINHSVGDIRYTPYPKCIQRV